MKKTSNDILRETYLTKIMDLIHEEDLGLIASNSINFPVLDNEGNEKWIEIVVKVPKENDGYEKREDYAFKVAQAKIKEQKLLEEKERKLALKEKEKREKQLVREVRNATV